MSYQAHTGSGKNFYFLLFNISHALMKSFGVNYIRMYYLVKIEKMGISFISF